MFFNDTSLSTLYCVVNIYAIFLSELITPQQRGLYTFLHLIYSVPRKFEFSKYLLNECTSNTKSLMQISYTT